MMNSINNLTNMHNSDINTFNVRLDSLISNLDNTISNNIQNKFHPIDTYIYYQSSTNFTYSGLNVTIPANSYYCLTANATWGQGIPRGIAINMSSTNANLTYSKNSSISEDLSLITTTYCSKTKEDTTFYVWAKYHRETENPVGIVGYYIN